MTTAATENDLDRPVWGVTEIAKVLERNERQTFHMLQARQISALKIGGRWVSTRRRLLGPIIGDAA
jgi:hypothetical protein